MFSEREEKIKKYLSILFVCFISLVSYCTLSTRSKAVKTYCWKQTSTGKVIGSGIMIFAECSLFSYDWPIIKKDGKNAGIVIVLINEYLVVFSFAENTIVYYMPI